MNLAAVAASATNNYVIDYPHRRARYLYYLVATLLITSTQLLAAIRTMIYSVKYFLGSYIAPANKGLLAFLALSTLRSTPLLATRLDKRSSTAAPTTARKLIAQHLDLSSHITQLLLDLCVLRAQRLNECYQFFAGQLVHISHLDN
ncbi:MAG: hypothetical protein M1133_13990 [Armatimonadetes bacterium]|nr:hypothetical protein [Armatimonadota bacterium]